MVPKQKKALGLGCTAMKQGKNLVLALGSTQQYSRQKECKTENTDRNYNNRNICILPDSRAASKALDKHQITSKLVWDCHQSLIQLGRHNRVQLIWVPGHKGIAGNETADHLTRAGSEHLFTGLKPAFGISFGAAKRAIKDWMNRKQIK
jgi:hypothetical protein